MKEAIIVCYVILLQMNVVGITTGILTYIRYTKESLKCFLLIYVSLQMIQTGLLLKACASFSGRETYLLQGIIRFCDGLGTLGMLFALTLFPFYIIGRKPGGLLKAAAAFLTVVFVLIKFIASGKGITAFIIVNQAIITVILLTVSFLILSSLQNLGKSSKLKAVGFVLGLSRILIPLILIKPAGDGFLLFQGDWFMKPLSLPLFLFLADCGGLLLIKTYFAVPFYVNPESGGLSEYFVTKFNITGREAEIVMLLRQGKAYKEIAAELTIAYKTVDAHIQNIYSKTGVNSRKQLLNLLETSVL